jgi:hypothetical protein
MNENDEAKQFFGNEELDEGKLFIEVPAEPKPHYQEKIPSGYDPMGEIYLRGRAYRGLSGGSAPWWVIISSWLIFGGLALVVLVAVLPGILSALVDVFSAHSVIDGLQKTFIFLMSLLPLGFSALLLIVVWRGTFAKISSRKRRSR